MQLEIQISFRWILHMILQWIVSWTQSSISKYLLKFPFFRRKSIPRCCDRKCSMKNIKYQHFEENKSNDAQFANLTLEDLIKFSILQKNQFIFFFLSFFSRKRDNLAMHKLQLARLKLESFGKISIPSTEQKINDAQFANLTSGNIIKFPSSRNNRFNNAPFRTF